MCFSVGASFGAGALLTATGIICVPKMQTPKLLPFASIPFIFGAQQIAEGVLWLTFSNPDLLFLQDAPIFLFLFFAQVIWPIWIPFSM